ncbi:MAG: hypothetical protein JSU81_06685 [Candidatus Coatesbacteria bacterium]|nr:MAG: hypothetical protein JSU81_06685 [Candidatus Coatesbacteria bacterium]
MATVTETIEYLFTDSGSLDDLRKELKRLSKDADGSEEEISRLRREIDRLEDAERSAARATSALSDSIRGVEGVGRILGGTAGEITGVLGDLEAVGEGAAGALGPAGLVGAMVLLAAAAVPVGVVKTIEALIDLSRAAVDARGTLEDLGGLSIVSDAGLAAVADLDHALDNLDAQFSRLLVELSPALVPVIDLVGDAVGRVAEHAQTVADLFAEISASDIAGVAGGIAGAAGFAGAGGGGLLSNLLGAAGTAVGRSAAGASGLGTGGRAFAPELDPSTAAQLAALGMIDAGTTTTTAGPDPTAGIRFDSGPVFRHAAKGLGMTRDPARAGRDPAAGVRFDTGRVFRFYTENIRELERIRDSLPALGDSISTGMHDAFSGLPTPEDMEQAFRQAIGAGLLARMEGGRAGGEATGTELVESVLGEVLGSIPFIGGLLEAAVGILADLPAFFDGLISTVVELPRAILVGLADVIADVPGKLIEAIPGLLAGLLEGIAKLLLSPFALVEGIISAIGRLPELFVKAFTGLPVKLLQFLDPEENGVFRGPEGRVLGIAGTEKQPDRVPFDASDPGYTGLGGESGPSAFRSGGGAILIGGWSEAADSLQTTLNTRRSFGGGYAGP